MNILHYSLTIIINNTCATSGLLTRASLLSDQNNEAVCAIRSILFLRLSPRSNTLRALYFPYFPKMHALIVTCDLDNHLLYLY